MCSSVVLAARTYSIHICYRREMLCFFFFHSFLCQIFFVCLMYFHLPTDEVLCCVQSFIQFLFWPCACVFGCLFVCVCVSPYLFALPLFTFEIWFDSNHKDQTAIIRFGFIEMVFYLKPYRTIRFAHLCAHLLFCIGFNFSSSYHKYTWMLNVQCSVFSVHVDLILNDKKV